MTIAVACLASYCIGEAASSIRLFAAVSALVTNYCLLIGLATITSHDVLLSAAMIGIGIVGRDGGMSSRAVG